LASDLARPNFADFIAFLEGDGLILSAENVSKIISVWTVSILWSHS